MAAQALPLGGLIEIAVVAVLLAQRSLFEHVGRVANGLDRSLEDGQHAVSQIVGRNPEVLDQAGVSIDEITGDEHVVRLFGIHSPDHPLEKGAAAGAHVYVADLRQPSSRQRRWCGKVDLPHRQALGVDKGIHGEGAEQACKQGSPDEVGERHKKAGELEGEHQKESHEADAEPGEGDR